MELESQADKERSGQSSGAGSPQKGSLCAHWVLCWVCVAWGCLGSVGGCGGSSAGTATGRVTPAGLLVSPSVGVHHCQLSLPVRLWVKLWVQFMLVLTLLIWVQVHINSRWRWRSPEGALIEPCQAGTAHESYHLVITWHGVGIPVSQGSWGRGVLHLAGTWSLYPAVCSGLVSLSTWRHLLALRASLPLPSLCSGAGGSAECLGRGWHHSSPAGCPWLPPSLAVWPVSGAEVSILHAPPEPVDNFGGGWSEEKAGCPVARAVPMRLSLSVESLSPGGSWLWCAQGSETQPSTQLPALGPPWWCPKSSPADFSLFTACFCTAWVEELECAVCEVRQQSVNPHF